MLTNLFEYLIEEEKVINKFDFFDCISTELSLIFAGLFYFIPNFHVNVDIKKKSTNLEKSNTLASYIYNKSLSNIINTKKDKKFILLISLMKVVNELLRTFVVGKNVF